MARPRQGFTIHLVRPGEPARVIYEHAEAASVSAISLDGSLIAISHSEHGDSRHPALRVLRPNGDLVGDLHDGPGKGVLGLRFAPVPGDRRLLTLHERRGRREPLVWDPETGDQREIWLRDPGEITADWYDDGRVAARHPGQPRPHPADPLRPPRRRALPDRDPARRDRGRRAPPRRLRGVLLVQRRPPAGDPVDQRPRGDEPRRADLPRRPSRSRTSTWTAPAAASTPWSPVPSADPGRSPRSSCCTAGPSAQDDDSFVPRGGRLGRPRLRGGAGQLPRLDRVRLRLAGRPERRGRAHRTRRRGRRQATPWSTAASSTPTGWCWPAPRGAAISRCSASAPSPRCGRRASPTVPIADHLAAYEDETEALRAYHRALLGGSPAEQPERYRPARRSPTSTRSRPRC